MTTAFRRLASTLTATVLAGGLLTACAGTGADTLTVAASSTPHAEILRHVEESGALGDVQLDIMTLTAGPEGNAAVANGSADVNFFQHEPFLHEWMAQNDSDNLVVLAPVHIEPMSVYSERHDSLDDLPEGAKVLLPRTETNFARGLRILQAHGLLTLDDQAQDGHAVVKLESVVDNPRNLELVAVEDELAPRGLADESVAAAIISSNYAMEAGLDLSLIHI